LASCSSATRGRGSAGGGWARNDAIRTWSVVTAVLVVSCPCAIGLAFPLADEMATTALRRAGVFVREADLWPRLARIRTLIFDKTGTLTLETPVLANPAALAALAPPARAALAVLVDDNPHPVAQCLHQGHLRFPRRGRRCRMSGLTARPRCRRHPGYGVSWVDVNGRWTLGRPGWRGGSPQTGCLMDDQPLAHDTELACDGVVLARFQFTDAVRADARAEIAALRARGLEGFLSSAATAAPRWS
jgi:Cu2+-exporting ATPase